MHTQVLDKITVFEKKDIPVGEQFSLYRGILVFWLVGPEPSVLKFIDDLPKYLRLELLAVYLHYVDECVTYEEYRLRDELEKAAEGEGIVMTKVQSCGALYLQWREELYNLDSYKKGNLLTVSCNEYQGFEKREVNHLWLIAESTGPGDVPWRAVMDSEAVEIPPEILEHAGMKN